MSQKLENGIYRKLVSWAGQLTKLSRSIAPKHLKSHIHTKVNTNKKGIYVLKISVLLNKNPKQKYGTKDARAQEYGSGLQAKRGSKKEYIIRPKKYPVLIFKWDKLDNIPNNTLFDGKKLVKKNKKGNAVFNYVEHPGIKAANEGKGYIAPAINELRKKARQELDPIVRGAILDALNTRPTFGRMPK